MIIISIITVILFIGSIIFTATYEYEYLTIGLLLSFLFGILFVCIVTVWPMNYIRGPQIQQYNTIKSMAEDREHIFDRAIIQMKINDINMELASYKYWNSIPIIQDMFDDKYAELPYLGIEEKNE